MKVADFNNLPIEDQLRLLNRFDKLGEEVADMKDTVHYQIIRNGKVRKEGCIDDLITGAGMAQLAALAGNISSPVAFGYVGIGSGATPADVSDTALETPIKIKAVTPTRITTGGGQTNDTLQWNTTFSSADTLSGTVNWTEIMVMTAASSYISLMHQVNTAEVLDWTAGDVLNLTITVQFKQG